MTQERLRKEVQARAEVAAEGRVVDVLAGDKASADTKLRMRHKLRNGDFDGSEIDIEVADSGGPATFEIPGMPGGSVGMVNIGDMLGKALGGGRTRKRTLTVKEAMELLTREESDKLLDQERVIREAREAAEQNGIVFIDEIDKICARSEYRGGGDVSREGVQRDLLPLIEGTTVNTKHGPLKTDHILFICSGAFHLAKPSDLLPELQGRVPIRVTLQGLTQEDFRRILVEPEASLLKQYKALLGTEKVELDFAEDAIDELARLAAEINSSLENIGARRLHTVLEKLLEEISFTASDRGGERVTIDAAYVRERVSALAKNADLSKFIL
jgi:ATP-dependent HslUV protease ATP-binding subunit HslU